MEETMARPGVLLIILIPMLELGIGLSRTSFSFFASKMVTYILVP